VQRAVAQLGDRSHRARSPIALLATFAPTQPVTVEATTAGRPCRPVGALDAAFYGVRVASRQQRFLIALDVSGSMGGG
jgi:hypothetical protein